MRRLFLPLLLLGAPAWAAITLDTGFPKTISSTATGGTSLTSASFSTTGGSGELMVACFVCGDETNIWGNTGTDLTFDGAGLTWSKQVQNSYTLAMGGSFVGYFGAACYTAVTSGNLSSQTVTIHTISSNAKTCALSLYALTGACTTAIGATGGEDDPTGATNQAVEVTLSVVAANSFLIGAFGDGDSAAGITAAANTTLDVTNCDGSTGSCYSTGRKTTLTSGAGSVSYGDSNSDAFNATAGLEILDAAASQCTSAGGVTPKRSLLGVGGRRPRPRRRRPLLPPRLGFFGSLGDIWRELTHVSYLPAAIGVGT